MSSWIESWLPGAAPAGRPVGAHPGERFGLPAEGVGSVAGFGRRLAALTVDWLASYLLVVLLLSGPDPIADPLLSWKVLGVWFLLTAAPVAVIGASAGMTLLGIRVASLGSSAFVGVPRAVLRTALTALVLPPLVRDADGRGWHDRAARTVVVRSRA